MNRTDDLEHVVGRQHLDAKTITRDGLTVAFDDDVAGAQPQRRYEVGDGRTLLYVTRLTVHDNVHPSYATLLIVPCLAALLALAAPRAVIVLLVIVTDYVGRAFDSVLWPLLGFFFLPTTTLAWAWAHNTRGEVGGVHAIIVVVAVLLDLGVIGSGRSWFLRRRSA